jgi:hypothetical protein
MRIANLRTIAEQFNPETTAAELSAMLDTAYKVETGTGWIHNKAKFDDFLKTGKPIFSIFAAGGNIKLPFLSFSSLPFSTCPGAGSCSSFCYSVKSWRYPASFFRQLQNTWLEFHSRETITDELTRLMKTRKFASMQRVEFRLFVDGDFSSIESLTGWMRSLANHPKIAAYGYSKSLQLFADYQAAGLPWPDNYKLNLSNGSIYDTTEPLQKLIKALPVYRGQFIAVAIESRYPADLHRSKEYRQAVKTAYDGRGFVCPGRCATCTKSNGHACGSDRFKEVPILIGIH